MIAPGPLLDRSPGGAAKNGHSRPPGLTAAGSDLFRKLSHAISAAVGSPIAFGLAVAIVLAWALCGPIFHFSDTWQLVINTGTTIVTFLMVFLIQNTQNRDARAIHLKLDELIRAKKGARNKVIDLENCTDEELLDLENEFNRMSSRIRAAGERAAHSRHNGASRHETSEASSQKPRD